MKATTRLRQLIQEPQLLILPGAFDGLSARLIEKTGFSAAIVGGYGISASLLGEPDVGLLTFSEMAGQVKNLARRVTIPLLCDADTGYGNVVNVRRTVQEYEQAGAAGLLIEDQVWPKRCGHMAGKEVVPMDEHVQKIQAAIAARQDQDFVIVARTDARGPLGLDEALRRARACQEAGADMIFVEAPQSVEELAIVRREIDGPLMANLVDHGKTPMIPAPQLESMGYQAAAFPVAPLYAAALGTQRLLQSLKDRGTTEGYPDLIPFSDFNQLLGLEEIRSWEKNFMR